MIKKIILGLIFVSTQCNLDQETATVKIKFSITADN